MFVFLNETSIPRSYIEPIILKLLTHHKFVLDRLTKKNVTITLFDSTSSGGPDQYGHSKRSVYTNLYTLLLHRNKTKRANQLNEAEILVSALFHEILEASGLGHRSIAALGPEYGMYFEDKKSTYGHFNQTTEFKDPKWIKDLAKEFITSLNKQKAPTKILFKYSTVGWYK